MADLRTRFIEDYAGGLLNIARQELSSTGEVLAQDGFVDNTALFVEDGRGVKSGLKLGSSLAECVDPTTETGVLNVRTADRTYAKIKDLKIFATAVASAQSALSDSVAESITNFEGAFESLENDFQASRSEFNLFGDQVNKSLEDQTALIEQINLQTIPRIDSGISSLTGRVETLETTIKSVQIVTNEVRSSGATDSLNNAEFQRFSINSNSKFYGITEISTSVPAWVTLYTDSGSMGSDIRAEGAPAAVNSGVIVDVITSTGNYVRKFSPILVAGSEEPKFYVKAVNKSNVKVQVSVTVKYIPL